MVSLAYWGTRDEGTGLTCGKAETADRVFRSARFGLDRPAYLNLWRPEPSSTELAKQRTEIARARLRFCLRTGIV